MRNPTAKSAMQTTARVAGGSPAVRQSLVDTATNRNAPGRSILAAVIRDARQNPTATRPSLDVQIARLRRAA